MRWLRGRHPTEPPTWSDDVRAAKARVATWAADGHPKLAKGEVLFEDLWIHHKVTFSRAQNMACAYCELSIAADPNGGDIDHYRPKGKITKLGEDPTTWGDEALGHNSRDPATVRQTEVIGHGYWWLAYDWPNYLLICGVCNRKWKLSLFPIDGGHQGAPTQVGLANERPLLLNPYGPIDPAEHLEFDQIGLVTPRNDSPLGFETIRTCHLGRRTLQESRQHVAEQAWPLIASVVKELGRVPTDARRLRCALRPLLKLGKVKRDETRTRHTGMVRILWAQLDPFNVTWEQLNEMLVSLRVTRPNP